MSFSFTDFEIVTSGEVSRLGEIFFFIVPDVPDSLLLNFIFGMVETCCSVFLIFIICEY